MAADSARRKDGRATLRRINRTQYENTLRDLLGLPALDVRDLLPEDGRVRGYDKTGPALEFSTVQIAKYLEAAGKALPLAIAPYPERDDARIARLYGSDESGIMEDFTIPQEKPQPKQPRDMLVSQLMVYATGTPVTFADRATVEHILVGTAATKHGIRSLVHALVQSVIFRNK